MDLEHIRIFVEAVRRGSFAAVARDKNVDPSSISRSIGSLEKSLGTRLLQRTTRKLAPTEAGMLYLGRVEQLLEDLEHAHTSVAEAAEQPRGLLRMLAPVSFGVLNLVPLVPLLAERHPGLQFDLVLTDAPVDMIAERIDLALRLGPMHNSEFIAHRLAPMVGKICASPAYLAKHGRPRKPLDLVKYNCLLLDYPGFGSAWTLTSTAGKKTEIQVDGNLRSSNAIALKDCALAGMGIILQGTWIVGEELRAGTLVDLFPSYTVTAATYSEPAMWAMYPSRSYLPQKVRVVLDALKQSYGSAVDKELWQVNGS